MDRNKSLDYVVETIRAEAKAEERREAAERVRKEMRASVGSSDTIDRICSAILADQAPEAGKVEGPQVRDEDLWQEGNLLADIGAIFDNNEGSDNVYDIDRIKSQIVDFIKRCPSGYLYESGRIGGMDEAAKIIGEILPFIARGERRAELERRIQEGR